MRKALISLVIVALVLTFPIAPTENMTYPDANTTPELDGPLERISSLASAGGSGTPIPATQYMSRVITGEQLAILNTFADTATHSGEIDLTSYLNPGWHVYQVTVDVNSMIAAPEREVVGQLDETINFRIDEVLGTFYSQLVQGFYNQPFDGVLNNYSIYYSTERYNPSLRGNASFMISSDYQTSAAITSSVNMTASEFMLSWASLSGENAALDANSVYWAVINGSTLYQGGVPVPQYPIIYWMAEDSAGTFNSYWRGASSWDLRPYEGILNYTYTPWNRTAGAALEFSSPESLSLLADSVPQTGFSWTFTNAVSNITSIQFNTNQSIILDYDLTIWYQDTPTVTTNWNVDISGNPVIWNATTAIVYPVFPETTAEFLNLTVESDWSTVGLYNSTFPGTDHGHNSRVGDIVVCTVMGDETWTLSCSAPNYVTDIALSDSSDSSPVTYYVDILTDMDIDAAIEDGIGTPINGGSTNLTVIQAGIGIYKPLEIAASGGIAGFTWDIDSTTSGNGTHFIEIFWTNGLEAGYFVTEVFVYYPTNLVADDTVVNAYAENTFDIGVNFDDEFLPRGLDGSLATVEYSFDGGANTSLVDQTGGRWTATVSTAGKTNGTYLLYVYAEGYALENQSLTITVNLIYETLALNWSWSNTNNIAYLDSTNLSVSYRFVNGSSIADATVTVTFQSSTHPLTWDPISETYWRELNGTEFTGVPDNFTLVLNAGKLGHESQYNDTNWIYVQSTTGEIFSAEYSPDLDILYIESMTISVTYNFSSVPIPNATVYVTFDGSDQRNLTFNAFTQKWEIMLFGIDYLGTQTINVTAMSDGYVTRFEIQTFVVQEDTPILIGSWTGNSSITDYVTLAPFSLTLTDSIGTLINDANVSFTAFGSYYELLSGVAGVYSFNIAPTYTKGIESFIVTVNRTGYVISQMTLNLTVEATTSLTLLHTSTEYEEWYIIIEADYRDTHYNTPITDAVVNITLGGTPYSLQYDDGVYVVNVTLNVANGTYTIEAFASALHAAYATDQSTLRVEAKEAVYIEIRFAPPQVVAGQFMEVRATLWSNDSEETVAGIEILFRISIYYQNGTVIHYTDSGMTDVTNLEGVATYGFDVPEGQIERLSATASYAGSRTRWNAETTETTGVQVSIIALFMSFLMSDIGLMMVVSIVLLGIVAAGYNRGVKPKKRAARLSLENQLQMFKDLESVQHFMAVYLDRGTCVFYHPFLEDRIQPDLISGFIAAITSVYGEIKGDGVRGTLEEIQYHGLRLNSYSGQYIIGILILEGEMTPLLRERLQFFVELFENQYDQDLDGWTGLVDCFDPEWVVSTLNSAFNYAWHLPHRFGPTQKVSKIDAKILDYIGAVRDERSEFYIKNLFAPLAEMLEKTEAEVLDRLLSLQDRGVIIPIGIQTILQRQGLALVDGTDESLIGPPPSVDVPEVVEEPEAVGELEFDDLAGEAVEEPEPVDDLEFDELDEKAVEEPEPEVDEMEAFVQDVESLLQAQAEDDKKEDDELDKFAKELRKKIGEDEESED